MDVVTSYYYDDAPTSNGTSTSNGFWGPGMIAIVAAYIVFIIVTVVGNLLVILSYATDSEIRKQVANLIILNLAIADFIVGLSSLTINLSRIISGRWLFGEYACKLYTMVDYLVISMSISMIVMISFDRHSLLTKQLRYTTFMSKRRVRIAIILIWIFFTSYFSLLSFGWTAFGGVKGTIDYTKYCYMEYVIDPVVTFSVTTSTTYVPLTCIAILNTLIFIKIKKQWNQFKRVKVKRKVKDDPSSMSTEITTVAGDPHKPANENGPKKSTTKTVTQTVCMSNTSGADSELASAIDVKENIKLAMKLAILVFFFAVCCVPFEVASLSSAICGESNCISDFTFSVCENLMWANSAINPILYALTNRRFRQNMKWFLCCRFFSKGK
ncbi:histamine H3 receptor-like [Diadema setosum]|uniref:histamine H3 receptor-like n=1 Tax=Diadema setosum TaxID=31175 RepID=UPI003B3B82EF